jgi:ribonuclease H / adenosylcobalamin/alpha-ribazole phosphatase
MCFEFDFALISDGGSLDHGAGNHGYGSYQLSNRDGRKETVRLDLGTATNNEAEYRTLIAGLKDLLGRIQRAGKAPSAYSLVIQTDSQLVVGQLTQGWQVKAANLRPLVDEAAGLLRTFGHTQLEKVPRAEIVRPAWALT